MDADTVKELRVQRSLADDTQLEVDCFLDDMSNAVMTRAGGYPDYPYNSGDWSQLKTFRPDVYTDTSFAADFSQYFAVGSYFTYILL